MGLDIMEGGGGCVCDVLVMELGREVGGGDGVRLKIIYIFIGMSLPTTVRGLITRNNNNL